MTSTRVVAGELSPLKSAFKWKIENVDTHLDAGRVSLYSPEFLACGSAFQLTLRIDNTRSSTDVSLFLKQKNFGKSVRTNASFSILDKEGTKCYKRITGMADIDPIDRRLFGFLDFIQRESLLNKLVNNELTILCELYPTAFDKCNEFLVGFEEMLIGKKCMSDFELIIGDQRLYVHKEVLSRKSVVFAAMFAHDLVENTTNSVIIEDLDYDTVVEMLRFVYTGEVKNIEDVVERLVVAADKYAFIDLRDVCADYLFQTMNLQNAIRYLEIAIRYNISHLEKSSRSFIIEYAHLMTDLPEFRFLLNLSDDVLLDIIAEMARRGNRDDDSPESKKRKLI